MLTLIGFQAFRTQRRVLVSLVIASAFALSLTAQDARAQSNGDLLVKYDQSQILRLPRRVSEVIIGNPAIAEVSVSSGKMLIVTGKAFGITNVIALDAEKQIIVHRRIIISRPSTKVVNLMRGTGRQSYNCTPQCNTALVIGDASSYFNSISSANKAKSKISQNAIALGAQSSE